jgi:hypothetical protein
MTVLAGSSADLYARLDGLRTYVSAALAAERDERLALEWAEAELAALCQAAPALVPGLSWPRYRQGVPCVRRGGSRRAPPPPRRPFRAARARRAEPVMRRGPGIAGADLSRLKNEAAYSERNRK